MNPRLELIIKVVDRVAIALVILKLLKVITIPWWLVFVPVWLFAWLALMILVVNIGVGIHPRR